MQAYLLREKFLDFFKNKKHKIVESDSLAPKDDPTVLFTPAGMSQFKREFLGFDSGFKRASTCQRCLRTDDLDKVGKTSGHHTFFEMLGNFSFGDYFKKEAILFAWEFLTEELKIKKDKLWVSVYKDDEETYKIWRDLIKVPVNKIIKLGDKENFWPSEAKSKGPNGPCGPCSEIFFDQSPEAGCGKSGCTPACGCGRFLEVWNLVFTQYNRKEGGRLDELPNKNIDTGMGLERLASVMQGTETNFETDLFRPLINQINLEVRNDSLQNRALIYAVADHARAVTFAIYDGILPSNEARGYVVRKLIRKSSLHLKNLGVSGAFLYKLVPVVAEIMGPYYPDLGQRKENISEVILAEEKNFLATLNSSDTLLEEKFQKFTSQQDPEEVGRIAFQLYDTYGMPLELTASWLEKHGINISKETFDKELLEQKNRSKLQSAMKGDVFSLKDTDYGVKATKFLGYKVDSGKAKVLKVIKDGQDAKKINKGEEAKIILDSTVFYPESGGQIGDSGEIVKGKNIFEVLETKKIGSVILHTGRVKSGTFKKNDMVLAKINQERRRAIERNHTATHLLQAALRKVLGSHVQQQGSLVAEDRLRFDFTHFKALDNQQLNRVEEFVNKCIIANHPVSIKQQALKEARKKGALAFFGEKYSDKVRVVSVEGVSSELCGGTHTKSSGQIGMFKITQEGSVASGVRRIEAATGNFAYKKFKEGEAMVDEISELLNVSSERLVEELGKKNTRLKELERELSSNKLNSLKGDLEKLIQQAEDINGIKVICGFFENLNMDLLRKNMDYIKEKTSNAAIALGSSSNGRAFLVMGLTEDLGKKGLDAAELVRKVSGLIGGSGGGRRDFAQAGGNKPENLEKAFTELKNIIRNLA